jgi:hypothetical protein
VADSPRWTLGAGAGEGSGLSQEGGWGPGRRLLKMITTPPCWSTRRSVLSSPFPWARDGLPGPRCSV